VPHLVTGTVKKDKIFSPKPKKSTYTHYVTSIKVNISIFKVSTLPLFLSIDEMAIASKNSHTRVNGGGAEVQTPVLVSGLTILSVELGLVDSLDNFY